MNDFFDQYLQGDCLRNLHSLYIHVIRPQRWKNNKVFLLPQQSNFALSLALLKHKVNKQRFIFEVIRRWSVINLITLIHSYLYSVLHETVVGYKKLTSFQGTQVNLSVLL